MQVLDGQWSLKTDPQNRGRQEQWFSRVQADACRARVPGTIQEIVPDYHGVVWYWHTFRPSRSISATERAFLHFGSVDYLAEVWVNGVPVGGHEGPDVAFSLDITRTLDFDADNLIAVRVLNPTDDAIEGIRLAETPHGNKVIERWRPGSRYNTGGIDTPVELLIVPAIRIIDLLVRPDVETGAIRVVVTVANDAGAPMVGSLCVTVGPASNGKVLDRTELDAACIVGKTVFETTVNVAHPHLWDLHDPFLYHVTVALEANAADHATILHQKSTRCGFRDFRVVDGYFRLNNRRIFLRSTHTGNHYPMGLDRVRELDFVRRDLIYAKASGFNMVRFIAKMALPEQLALCDEIGLMVYEETQGSWCLEDSPAMAERYDRAMQEMILRDSNHPCVTIWGMLNETRDGAVFRHAVDALALVRSLDDTRLVLLSSGRWDGHPAIGSVSNPGSQEWEHVWGREAANAPPVSSEWAADLPAYLDGAGDAHLYPHVPHVPAIRSHIRTLGADTKPVFLSEYGIGSLFNAIREYHLFEQDGARTDTPEATLMRSMADAFVADWERFGMDQVYAFPEHMLHESQRLHARQRLLGFDMIRSNPNICGYNLTGMLDHAITGEGVWTYWREWKPEIVDALADGWAALRWCLFCDTMHGYAGRSFRLEAVLANEGELQPGSYPARLRVIGPAGVVWEKRTNIEIPQPEEGQDGPLAVPVICEDVVVRGPAGTYEFAAMLERGGSPAGGRLTFHVAEEELLPCVSQTIRVWGIPAEVEDWLSGHGVICAPFQGAIGDQNQVVLVGEPDDTSGDQWRALARCMAQGSTVIFLSPSAFQRDTNPMGWLPLVNKGRWYTFHDWLYHKECVSKAHPIFAGLQPRGIMDWEYYGPVIPHELFDGQDTPDDVAAAAFALGYNCPGGYASGVLVGTYNFGNGRFYLNTLRILNNIGLHPAADRLLLNLISSAATATNASPLSLPSDFESRLTDIGYR